jgi:hypothetical protein
VAVTRARWLTGALIGGGAMYVAVEALATYIAGHLVVGIVAVLVLMGVLAIGLVSLSRARRYIAGELSTLGAEPPSGALYQARRAQLAVLRRRGVEPDLDVLADATAAEEAGRGYTGRYLVATTVLIGLVGTFGGLMETLGRVAPLLKGDLPSSAAGPAGAFALIAGPLAGLHVTFGTSVVAILVTLALALIQGDVTLHHEQLLALLQERTRHVLVPELWPADESVGERTVRALLELRAFVAESLTASAAASAERIAGVVRVEVQRLVTQIGSETQAAAATQTAALERTGTLLTEGFRKTSESAARELRDAAATARDTMTAAATSAREAVATAASASHASVELTATASREAIATASRVSREAVELTAAASGEAIATASKASRESVELAAAASREAFESAAAAAREQMAAAIATLTSATARTSESVATSTETVVASLGALQGSLSAQLEGASQALATSATELRGAVGALSPTLSELAPQLAALSAEIALLAARAEAPEHSNAVLDELVRLGEDIERLLASSQPRAATDEVAAHEAES